MTLRTLLIHGVRSVLRLTPDRYYRKNRWVGILKARACDNVAAEVLAARGARIIWAMLARGTESQVTA